MKAQYETRSFENGITIEEHRFDHLTIFRREFGPHGCHKETIVFGEDSDWLAGDASATSQIENSDYRKVWFAHRVDAEEFATELLLTAKDHNTGLKYFAVS